MIIKLNNIMVLITAAIKTLPALYKIKKMNNPEFSLEKKEIILKATHDFGNNVLNKKNIEIVVNGIENCNNVKTALFVANHQSLYDIPLLVKVVPGQIGFIAKMELKKVPIVNEWIKEMNGVFLDRNNKREALKAIRDGILKLKEGNSLVIFPEGTRSNGEGIKEFKTGSLTLAHKANVPIIPVAIEGTYNIKNQKKSKIIIDFLNPIFLNKDDKLNDIKYVIQRDIEDRVEKNKQLIKK